MRTFALLPLLPLASGFISPSYAPASRVSLSKVHMGGKGFGGGEATRDPAPTAYDPSDPKGKQQAIHKAVSFAEYLAKRGGGAAVEPFVAALTYEEKLEIRRQEAAQEAAEDATFPPLPAGCSVEFTTPAEWLSEPLLRPFDGRTGKVRNFDEQHNKYYVWMPHEPTGQEETFDKPLLMLVRRAHMQQI
ncbi:MAG: hypothetical protein SGPRY_009245 [Prymnesium sp.]